MYFGKMHDLRVRRNFQRGSRVLLIYSLLSRQQRGGVTLGETIQHSTHVDIMGTTLRRWKKYEDDLKVAAAKQCDVRTTLCSLS